MRRIEAIIGEVESLKLQLYAENVTQPEEGHYGVDWGYYKQFEGGSESWNQTWFSINDVDPDDPNTVKKWVVDIKDKCQESNVPFFFKQWGGVNKKKSGRNLDGKTYDEMPKTNIIIS